MKNLVTILMVLGLVVGGGLWLTSGSENSGDGTEVLTPPITPGSTVESIPEAKPKKPAAEEEEEIQKPEISETGPWPAVVVPQQTFNFGSMLVGQKQSHVFEFKNEGEADLELVEGKPTCKCTKFELDKHILKPGDTAHLTVEWHGKFVDHTFAHGGPVYTNDPKSPQVRINVMGLVDDAIEVMPPDTWVVRGQVGQESHGMTGYLLSRVLKDLEITHMESNSEYLLMSNEDMPREKAQINGARPGVISAEAVTIKLDPQTPPGTFDAVVKVHVESVEDPIVIDVKAKQDGPVKIIAPPGVLWNDAKSGLAMGRFPTSKGREVILNMIVNEEGMTEPFAFTSVEASPHFLTAELSDPVEVGPQRKRYKLKIAVPPGIPRMNKPSRDPGHIVIKTNHPSGQTFNILVSFNAF